jgi:hypothetical protein
VELRDKTRPTTSPASGLASQGQPQLLMYNDYTQIFATVTLDELSRLSETQLKAWGDNVDAVSCV